MDEEIIKALNGFYDTKISNDILDSFINQVEAKDVEIEIDLWRKDNDIEFYFGMLAAWRLYTAIHLKTANSNSYNQFDFFLRDQLSLVLKEKLAEDDNVKARLDAIGVLGKAFSEDAKYKRIWMDYIEMTVTEGLESIDLELKEVEKVRQYVADRLIAYLFDRDWWELQGDNDQEG